MEASTSLTLIVMSGPSAGASYALEGVAGHIVMGSDPSANIQFEGAAVAAKHAMIVIDENGVAVQPTGEDAPLYVNDDSILGPTVINDGDILWMGTPGDDGAVMLQCQLGPARDLTQDVDEPLDASEAPSDDTQMAEAPFDDESAEPEAEAADFFASAEAAEDGGYSPDVAAADDDDDDGFVTPELVPDDQPLPEAASEGVSGFASDASESAPVFQAESGAHEQMFDEQAFEPEESEPEAFETDEPEPEEAGAFVSDERFDEEQTFEQEPEVDGETAVVEAAVVDTAEHEPFVDPEQGFEEPAEDDEFYEPEAVAYASEENSETMAYTDTAEVVEGEEAEFIEPEEESPFLSDDAEPAFYQPDEPVVGASLGETEIGAGTAAQEQAFVGDGDSPAFIDDGVEEESPFQTEATVAEGYQDFDPGAATVVDDGTVAQAFDESEETQVLHGYEPVAPDTPTPETQPPETQTAEFRSTEFRPEPEGSSPGTDTRAPTPAATAPPQSPPQKPPARQAVRPRAAAAPAARPARRPPAPRPAARPRAAAGGRPARKGGSSPTGLYLGIAGIVIIGAGAGAYFMAKGIGGGSTPPPPTTMPGITPPTTLSAGGSDALPDPGALPEPGLPPLEPLETPGEAIPDPALDGTPDPALAEPPVETLPVETQPVATPEPTPTPRATPTPTPRPTPTPGPSGPTPAQIKAQQIAQLMSQAGSAAAAGQFDNAARIYGEVLALDPNHAQAKSGRTTTAATAAALKKSFAPGRTAYASPSKGGGPAGFDTAAVADPDYVGELAFEVSPSRVKGGDAYTIKVYLQATGEKAIKIASLNVTTASNQKPERSAPAPRARQAAAGQRVLVHEHAGTWDAATQSWYLEVVATSARGDTYRSRLTW